MSTKPDYILIDTEFVREKTYFSKLCLIQVSGPGIEPHYIDPLDSNTDLTPLKDMLLNPDITKVMHSGYQDMEIFYKLLDGRVPSPVFDTQIAASVLGYGEQVSYANLVKDICDVEISKSQQFTDWSIRPLSQAQIDYALGDVIYLDQVYQVLKQRLTDRNRTKWIIEDFKKLANPDTYTPTPDTMYEKIKMRSSKQKHLGILKEIAAWREKEAMRRDMPRNYVARDDTLMEIAMTMPNDTNALSRVRGFPSSQVGKPFGKAMLNAVKTIKSMDNENLPNPRPKRSFPSSKAPILEMLRLLLKIVAVQNDLTPSRIADKDDLEQIALNGKQADVKAMQGWRYELFGSQCSGLISGKAGIYISDGKIELK
jgi:ribonuclease D